MMPPVTPMDQLIVDELVRIIDTVDSVDEVGSEPYIGQPKVRCAVEVIDGTETGEQHGKAKRNAQLNVSVRVFQFDDPETGDSREKLRRTLHAIRWQLAQCDMQQFPEGTRQIIVGSRQILEPEQGSQYVAAEQTVAISYTERFSEDTP